MDIIKSKNSPITKFIHTDKSETIIKCVPSCNSYIDPDSREMIVDHIEKNKYTMFSSCSSGCQVGCKFCYLTIDNYPYKKLSPENIFINLRDAFLTNVDENFKETNKFIKLSWMGMGDAALMGDDIFQIKTISKQILDLAIHDGLIVGVDSIDIGTCMPKINNNMTDLSNQLNDLVISNYPINPKTKYTTRSRLFLSIHSAINKTRKYLIPTAAPIGESIECLLGGIRSPEQLIFHHIFIDGINDTKEECDALKKLFEVHNLQEHELRILRFNGHPNSPLKESSKFEELSYWAFDNFPKVKFQSSPGSDIGAACGQF